MLQIKNTLGGGKPEGMYVWKKCVGTGVVKETPSTERYYFTTSQSESVTIYYSSSYTYDDGDFVLTNPSEINIALGAYNAIEANLYFMANTSRGNVMLKSSSGSNNQRTVIYNQKSGLFAHCPDSSYPFYICNDTYEFLDYIVSDKETAYPDGGEKGGYWYEKVVDGLDLSELGFTMCETGEITCSSSSSFSIPHSLGVEPKVILLISSESITYGAISIATATRYLNGSSYYYLAYYGTANDTQNITDIFETYYAGGSPSTLNLEVTATTSDIEFSSMNNYFRGGDKFKYLFLG